MPKLGKHLIFRDNKVMNTSAVAQNLASRGRNGDTTLVHMTPGEVGGLQKLAMAHGGSLTINPETGLPEANFLKSLLPTIAGVALSPIMGPMGAALAVGGIQALRTKDLGQGLMAGLGAYGGAGLGKSLGAMGTPTVMPPPVAAGLDTATGAFGNVATNAVNAGVSQTAPSIIGSAAPANAYSAMATGAKQLIQPGGLTALRANMVGNPGKKGAKKAHAGGGGGRGGGGGGGELLINKNIHLLLRKNLVTQGHIYPQKELLGLEVETLY